MSFSVRTIAGNAPLVLDSPHSGVNDPDDFRHACARLQVLLRTDLRGGL